MTNDIKMLSEVTEEKKSDEKSVNNEAVNIEEEKNCSETIAQSQKDGDVPELQVTPPKNDTMDIEKIDVCPDSRNTIAELTNSEKSESKKIPEQNTSPVQEQLKEKIEYMPWQAVGEAVVGMSHRRGTVPVVCQDAYCIENSHRTVAVVCDGAGSSVLSEIGSQQLSQGIVRLLYSIEKIISPLLDINDDHKAGNKLAEIIYRYSIRLLQDIAANYKRSIKDFRSTLLLVITGKENLFWFKVGDGEIVVENDKQLSCIGKSLKGEYSNETVFIDEGLKINDVQYGIMDVSNITGIAVMSDGTSERLVSSSDRKIIAKRLSTFFESQRNSKLPREELYKFLNDYETWKGGVHDDKTLVVISRKRIIKGEKINS